MIYHVKTFYFFRPLSNDQLSSVRSWLVGKASDFKVLGLIILGTEGLNTTLASQDPQLLGEFISQVFEFFGVSDIQVKSSLSEKPPFRKFVVKIREEIVTLGKPEFIPESANNCHLSPKQWHEKLSEDVVVIDTRNDYEIEIGSFRNAVDLKMKEFSEFPQKIKEMESDKSKPHLIFCTGGIRCEKAIFEMKEQGYQNVYQLEGGILNYMEAYPEGEFLGECFVFDSRVSVGKDLRPSQKYSLCPQCGEVGSQEIACKKCDESSKLCKKCMELVATKPEYETCSKNCRYHYQRDPAKKGPQQKQFYHG